MRTPLIVLILAYTLSVTGFLLIPGTLEDGSEWRMDFFHAFYFVSYMGSTIGFGELPHPFNGAQRIWTLFSIYATVISWLYAIGRLISLLQNRDFVQALSRSRSQWRIAHMKEPFFLLCGYGEAGKVVAKALDEVGMNIVVVDQSPSAIAELELSSERASQVGVCADASDPEQLKCAGLTHSACQGVIAVIGNDQENLKIAITSKLLNPDLQVIGRVNENDTADNMRSFGTDHILNPFKTFAWHFGLAFSSPGLHLLNDWLSQTEFQQLVDPVFPPRGKWILCGYGRFGKALYQRLVELGNEVTVIDIDLVGAGAPTNAVLGRGTEAVTLRQAGIEEACGIIAGTDHDANNLSILVTATGIKNDLFTVGRQNQTRNAPLFQAAIPDVVIDQNRLIANRVLSILTTPLTREFLYKANRMDTQWSNILVSRISGILEDNAPSSWVVVLDEYSAPAFERFKTSLTLGDLYREPYNRKSRLKCLPLMLKRQDEYILTPENSEMLSYGDLVLFCGRAEAHSKMLSILNNQSLMNYVISGHHSAQNPVWLWLSNHFGKHKQRKAS